MDVQTSPGSAEAPPRPRRGGLPWWRTSEVLTIGLAMLMLVLGLRSMWTAKRTLNELGTVLSEAYSAELAFEREIGFGGLIHNFKNAVLRQDEPAYRTAALENVRRARVLIGDLARAGESLGLNADWDESRRVVESYAAGLNAMQGSGGKGFDAEQLDDLLRIDDAPALQERGAAREALTGAVLARLASARAASVSGSTVLALAVLALLVAGVAAARSRRDARRHVEASKALEQSLDNTQRANKGLQQFAGIASHDLSKPMRHVSIFVDLIDDDVEDPEQVRAHVERIRETLGRMGALVQRLLEYTRDGFGRLHIEPIDTHAMVGELIQQMELELEASNCEIQVDELPTCPADRELLRRVFTNLLDNALKYADESRAPRIHIGS